MSKPSKYQVQDFSKLKDLNGIPNNQIEIHLGLYEGYVKNVNLLNQKIYDLAQDNKIDQPEYAELKRRLGFEYGGMVLHELYFQNLDPNRESHHPIQKKLDT
ncbi:MAG TPA: hypothetical protein VNX68_07940, partial [Nitrosopumilaceae archaeon]|nr:hypothetical protein [Nitrosopumilaceae archaeon]